MFRYGGRVFIFTASFIPGLSFNFVGVVYNCHSFFSVSSEDVDIIFPQNIDT
jgi:hypothetical protein